MFRRSLEPRVDIFFAISTWIGVPEIREPHKWTELVWADPAQRPDDTLDFLGQAWADAREGHPFREYGFPPGTQSVAHQETRTSTP